MFKRTLALGLIASLMLGTLPQAALADSPLVTTSVTATAPVQFDPSAGPATITFTANPNEARGVQVTVYKAKAVSGTRECHFDSSLFVTQLFPVLPGDSSTVPANTPKPATWNALKSDGVSYMNPGLYCYNVLWSNPAPGSTYVVDGLISVLPAGSMPGGDNTGSTGGSSSGTGTGGTTGNTGGTINYNAPVVTASASPDFFDPNSTDASNNKAVISYTINQTIPNGTSFSMDLFDRNGNSLETLIPSVTGGLPAGRTGSFTWYGHKPDGRAYDTGIYELRFKVGTTSVSSVWVDIRQGVYNPSSSVFEFSVNPSFIDPTASVNNAAEIGITANRNIIGNFVVVVKDSNNTTVRTLYTPKDGINSQLLTGSNLRLRWNGKYANGCEVAANRTYTVRFSNNGVEYPDTGKIFVAYQSAVACPTQSNPPSGTPDVPAVFVTRSGISPTIFVPENGESTLLTYTLGKSRVWNFVVSVRDEAGVAVKRWEYDSMTSGDKSVSWYGTNFRGDLVDPGRYTFYFNATGESEVRGPTVRVEDRVIVTPLVVTDRGADPSSFVFGRGTTFRYEVNQASRADLTVWSGSPTLSTSTVLARPRRGIVSGTNNSFPGGVLSVPWDGRNEFTGSFLPARTEPYFYSIEAETSAGARATAVYGTFTVNAEIQPQLLNITSVSSDPNPFYTETQGQTNFRYSLNQAANVMVTVTRASDSAYVNTLTQTGAVGANSLAWNGRDWMGNRVTQSGDYRFQIAASAINAQYGNDTETGVVNVQIAVAPQQQLQITNVSADPNPFYPNAQASASLRYSLNFPASVTLTLTRASDNAFVNTLTQNGVAGANSISWDGRDFTGARVSQSGDYRMNIAAVAVNASYGNDTETGVMNVQLSTSCVNTSSCGYTAISDSPATPNPFDPWANQTTRIDFTVTPSPSSVKVQVYRESNNEFIRELPIFNLGGNLYRAEWNGRFATNNAVVQDARYYYRIEAVASGQIAQKIGYVTVQTGTVVPQTLEGNCAGFTDVRTNHYLCQAIEFSKSKGIFAGYPDGTIGLDRVIQRAELLAVIQKAFRFPLDSYSASSDGDLGFKDLDDQTNEWYMPYVKTFKRLEIMVGYPDKHMRPDRTMNTAELFLVFLKAAKKSSANVANFTLKNHELTKFAPFIDTPKVKSTEWYLKYAGFAKLNGLVLTERFYPSRGITRGQVIQLVYDTHRKGLIRY